MADDVKIEIAADQDLSSVAPDQVKVDVTETVQPQPQVTTVTLAELDLQDAQDDEKILSAQRSMDTYGEMILLLQTAKLDRNDLREKIKSLVNK